MQNPLNIHSSEKQQVKWEILEIVLKIPINTRIGSAKTIWDSFKETYR